jgi:hypothetical protein
MEKSKKANGMLKYRLCQALSLPAAIVTHNQDYYHVTAPPISFFLM